MDDVRRQQQREIDEDILAYVREAQKLACVQEESITKFLVITRRRKITAVSVRDRIDYLTSAGLLKSETVWEGGELTHYTITALGMDVLDGNVPPPNWRR
jgi:hypothetical protein